MFNSRARKNGQHCLPCQERPITLFRNHRRLRINHLHQHRPHLLPPNASRHVFLLVHRKVWESADKSEPNHDSRIRIRRIERQTALSPRRGQANLRTWRRCRRARLQMKPLRLSWAHPCATDLSLNPEYQWKVGNLEIDENYFFIDEQTRLTIRRGITSDSLCEAL